MNKLAGDYLIIVAVNISIKKQLLLINILD